MVERLNNSTGILATLRALQGASVDLARSDQRMSSTLKVTSARDDVPAFHAAEVMKAQGGSLNAVTMSLSRAESISDTAIAAAEKVSDLLIQMQETVTAATGEDLTEDQRAMWMSRFADQKRQIEAFIRNATFDDSNILDGSRPQGVSFIADSEANVTLTLAGRNFLPGLDIVTLDSFHDLHNTQNAYETKAALEQSIRNVGEQLAAMAGERKRIEAQKGFVGKLADALAAGVGRMVDADLAYESALIQALQVKQQLATQAVGIVNAAPQTLLSLFRG
ncbi:MAG TPA: flagellin [Hyphomonadaceae bacterium]|nr:flagellin [Hyphomonadaceae bacterium]